MSVSALLALSTMSFVKKLAFLFAIGGGCKFIMGLLLPLFDFVLLCGLRLLVLMLFWWRVLNVER